jgi:cytidylate kinase
MTRHPAITVSRTLGSGGAYIAYRVAQRLGWRYCDRSILRQAAERLGLEPADLDAQEERPGDFLDRLMRLLPAACPDAPYMPPADLPLYGTELFTQEGRIMRGILQQGPAVFVGRGGFVALGDHPDALHVHVQANPEFRIRRLVETGRAGSDQEARELIRASDRDRQAFIRALAGRPWNDPANFHLVLDAGDLGFDGCVAAILGAAKARGLVPAP